MEFEKLLNEAVDEGLKNAVCEGGRQIIVCQLEEICSVKGHGIAEKPEAFAAGLQKIFGEGAGVVEEFIVRNLFTRLGLKYEDKKDFMFADYVKEAKECNKCP